MDKIILHCDLNNFFASCACIADPALSLVPMAVCGDPESRHGIVLAKNTKAKKMGVTTGEPIFQARQKCPEMRVVKPDYPLYMDYSQRVKKIYERYSGHIEPFSIDECWLDVTPVITAASFGEKTAWHIKETIKKETGLTASVGVSWNKIYAKLGSDMKKPDAVTVLNRQNYRQKIWPLKAGDLLYVGRVTEKKLASVGILTIGQIAEAPVSFLRSLLGKNGEMLHHFANGMDRAAVCSVAHDYAFMGIGNSMTTARDLTTAQNVKAVFYYLAEMVGWRLRKKNVRGGVLCIYIRDRTLKSITRQKKLPVPTAISGEILKEAMRLFDENWNVRTRPVRSLGIRMTALDPINASRQLCFFDPAQKIKQEALEYAKDYIRSRYGGDAIVRALLLKQPVKSKHAKELHIVHPLSYFRA